MKLFFLDQENKQALSYEVFVNKCKKDTFEIKNYFFTHKKESNRSKKLIKKRY